MAYDAPLFKIPGLVSAADLKDEQFKFVKLTASETVNVAGAGEEGIGILQNKPEASQAAEVMHLGVSKLLLAGAVSAGDRIASDANGEGVEAVSTNYALAIALEDGADNDLCTVLLIQPQLLA